MEIGLQEIKKTIDDVKDLDPENVIYRASGSVMIKVDNFKKLITNSKLGTTLPDGRRVLDINKKFKIGTRTATFK